MANRMPMQPGDGSNPAGAQGYYYPQNGTPPQQMYLNYPFQLAQLQAYNAQQQQQMQYQNFLESQRRAQTEMRNRGQPMPGHPPQMQQQQQQQQQRMPGMPGMPGYPSTGALDHQESFDQKSQAEKDALQEFMRSQNAAGKMFQQQQQQQQRVPPPQQQQQRGSGMPGYPSSGADREDTFDPNNQADKDAMLELLRTQGGTAKLPPQRNPQQQQQRPPGMPGYPSAGMEQGDGFEQKTQAEKDAMLDLLRAQSGPNKAFPPRTPQQQQQQQQRGPGLAPGMAGAVAMMPGAGVGPHFDPAITAAIASGSPTAAPNNMHLSPAAAANVGHPTTNTNNNNLVGAGSPNAGAAGRGKIEVEDEYGLKPLVKVLAAAPPMTNTPHVPTPDEPTDPTTGRPISQIEADEINFSFITRGFDITQLGLSVSQQEWLHPTLATLPLDTHNYFILPEFKIPDSYKKPRPRSLSMKSFHQFKEETLFYIFYSMPRDVLHLAAARALYERGWRYHKREQHWFHPVKLDDGSMLETVTTAPDGQKIYTGVYNVFHPNEWKQVRTAENYTVSSNDVEDQSVLVAAMEEAARQQSQRSRAKAGQPAAGTGGNGNGSPVNASPAASA